MTLQTAVDLAVRCLESLAENPTQSVSAQDLSAACDVPLNQCLTVLRQLAHARVLKLSGDSVVGLERAPHELSALHLFCVLLDAQAKDRNPSLKTEAFRSN